MKYENTYFIQIDDVTIGNSVTDEYFFCDLEKCKGACCTLEDAYGAPLTIEEANILAKVAEEIKHYLPTKSQAALKKFGPIEKHKGSYHTRTVEERECIFVYWENDVAKCAVEKSFFKSEIDFRKPISCHLFPIRKNYFGHDVLRAEFLKICDVAMTKGLDSKTFVYEFCKDSLVRLYGTKWYDKLRKLVNDHEQSKC